jgi:hypothetical protein
LKIITFYAECELPEGPRKNQEGFDWREAIQMLARSGRRFGYETLVVTDEKTQIDAWLRVGDASKGLMLWLLEAQAKAVSRADGEAVMVSPDTLIAEPLGFLFGKWDMTLLTRRRPKPIVNSVIAFKPGKAVSELWGRVVEVSRGLPDDSKTWGADIDALVKLIGIQPMEDGIRKFCDTRIRLMPMNGKFQSVGGGPAGRINSPLWDFKGARKAKMAEYARILRC